MESYVYLCLILLVGFVVYVFIRDRIFDVPSAEVPKEPFEVPAPASIEIRQAPIYPERVVAPSGPNSPNQAPPHEQVVIHREPAPTDPYSEEQESSDIPENLRHPERSFRAPPMNDNVSIATQSGVASRKVQVSSNNTQQFEQEFIQGGGEFMPGIFANDTFDDKSYSSF
jgi:hypothetical protein